MMSFTQIDFRKSGGSFLTGELGEFRGDLSPEDRAKILRDEGLGEDMTIQSQRRRY